MAARFGGARPAHSYASKIKFLVAGLLGLIAVLLVAIIFVVRSTPEEQAPEEEYAQADVVQQPVEAMSSSVEIMLAATRIEEGAELKDHMFRAKPWNVDELPEGAILFRDMESIRGKFAKVIINAHLPLLQEHVTNVRPISALNIPPGFRAVTIEVDARSGVEGFAKPDTRVDVLWTYTGPDGQQKVSTIVRFTKVLSVAGSANAEGERAKVGGKGLTTVTLLVSEKDAKKIELARTLGKLSLSLVGDQEEVMGSGEHDAIDISDLLGEPANPVQEEDVETDGVMYTVDPVTGKRVRYILKKGRWKRAAE